MIKESHLTIFNAILKDAHILSITPLKGVETCGIFYDDIKQRYVVTGFNIEYDNSLLHTYIKHPKSLEEIK